jgi:hypothetical protein
MMISFGSGAISFGSGVGSGVTGFGAIFSTGGGAAMAALEGEADFVIGRGAIERGDFAAGCTLLPEAVFVGCDFGGFSAIEASFHHCCNAQ